MTATKKDDKDGGVRYPKPEYGNSNEKAPVYSHWTRKIQRPTIKGTVSRAAIRKAVKEVIAERAARK